MTITLIGGQVKGHRDLTVIIIKWDARARVSVFERMRFSHMSQKNEKYLDSLFVYETLFTDLSKENL